ncbi:MAG: hypothetical protein QM785_03015 [Pyrinomonadaceae bacterium]
MFNLLATTLLTISSLCYGFFVPAAPRYSWTSVTAAANYPQGYNFPVYSMRGWMIALNNGAWISKDGKKWTKTALPDSGLNSGYQKYVNFNGAIYALGSMTGNYEKFTVSPKILRTKDLNSWETLAETSNLPQRVFYGMTVFNGKMWLLGGFDGKEYHNDVWNSSDGVHWTRVVENAKWSPRNVSVATVFNDKIWLFGGGVIDGNTDNNRNSYKEVWVSKDGISWERVMPNLDKKWGGTPVVFDGRLWLVGMNRGTAFASAVWMTEDGEHWNELTAPWSPRGAVAAWVFDNKLYMTGGKSSHTENGEIKFVYSNDVWSMSRDSE